MWKPVLAWRREQEWVVGERDIEPRARKGSLFLFPLFKYRTRFGIFSPASEFGTFGFLRLPAFGSGQRQFGGYMDMVARFRILDELTTDYHLLSLSSGA
jgi:hypothetical protein